MKAVIFVAILLASCSVKKSEQLIAPWGDASCARIDLAYNEDLKGYELKGWNPIECPMTVKLRWTQHQVDYWHKAFGICSARLGRTHCADRLPESGLHPLVTASVSK